MLKFLLFFFSLILGHTETLFILIHGTWANDCCWHSAKNEFFRNIEKALKLINGKLICFYWPGNLNHQSRYQAGIDLATLIENQNYNPISIIAHSHGANVAIIASHILENKIPKKYIHSIYALGCPIDEEKYMPNMQIIKYFYNFYSLNDIIQPVFWIYKRTFSEHERIINIQIKINGSSPGHSALHSPVLAYWIPLIHEYLQKEQIGNFDNFKFDHRRIAIIDFFTCRHPTFKLE